MTFTAPRIHVPALLVCVFPNKNSHLTPKNDIQIQKLYLDLSGAF